MTATTLPPAAPLRPARVRLVRRDDHVQGAALPLPRPARVRRPDPLPRACWPSSPTAPTSVEAPAARRGRTSSAAGRDDVGAANASAHRRAGDLRHALRLPAACWSPSWRRPSPTGAISLEREKATLDLLVTTPLRPGAIVVGKLLSALAFVILMILAGIPVSALVLMYGGVSVEDIVRAAGRAASSSAIGFGVIGLFCSALIKRTQSATVIAYSTVLVPHRRHASSSGASGPRRLTGVDRSTFGARQPGTRAAPLPEPGGRDGRDRGRHRDHDRRHGRDHGRAPRDQRHPVRAETSASPTAPRGGGAMPGGNGQPGVIADCPPNARCAASSRSRPSSIRSRRTPATSWPRFALTFAGLSLLLTLASMRLVVPAGLRLPAALAAGIARRAGDRTSDRSRARPP